MKNTLVVNLLGGSGVGKSGLACGILSLLKKKGIDCEISLEYVKNMVYEGRTEIFKCQPLIFANQLYSLQQLKGKTKVIITDRPLFLDIVYDPEQDKNFRKYILRKFNEYNNMNVVLNRTVPFKTTGRLQATVEDARYYDTKVLYWLNELQVPYFEMNVDDKAESVLYEAILSRLITDKIYENQ